MSQLTKAKILVIIPARNEEKFIGKTLEALSHQKPKPEKIIIIDDGSNDKTSVITKETAEKASLNHCILKRKDRGFTALGQATLAKIYNEAFNSVDLSLYDFLVILGADSVLEDNYFQRMLQHFEDDPKLVIASGYCPGEEIKVGHVHGIGRFYRMDFFREDCKGRFEISNAWESIPIFIANVNGDRVRSFKEPLIYHMRPRFTRAPERIYLLRGSAMREVGYWTPYAIGRSILTSFRRRQIKAGVFMFVGFIKGKTSKPLTGLAHEYKRYQIHLIKNILL